MREQQKGTNIKLDLKNDFTHIETEECDTYVSKERIDGFLYKISFTKNKEEHEESLKAIKEFFIREFY
ncbi:hypothetical protein ACTXGU_00250 [Niallia sp. 01092]|uniref:hypothetical protein n=1 Tax=Niallia sp. 01092 TaxID=3457759 RepID=UPI003FD49C3A